VDNCCLSRKALPDVSYAVAHLCQVRYKAANTKDFKLLNDTATFLNKTKDLTLKYSVLHKDKLRLYIFVDSGYHTNLDCTSQLRIIVFFTDYSNRCHFLHWPSAKCPRITKSMHASETYTFSAGFDYGISLRMLFKKMHIDLPLYVFTDCKSIFDTITDSKRLRELRLMNEISDIRRAYRDNEITNVGWIRSEQNIAENLTRLVDNKILRTALETGRLQFTIEQWVYKDDDSVSTLG